MIHRSEAVWRAAGPGGGILTGMTEPIFPEVPFPAPYLAQAPATSPEPAPTPTLLVVTGDARLAGVVAGLAAEAGLAAAQAETVEQASRAQSTPTAIVVGQDMATDLRYAVAGYWPHVWVGVAALGGTSQPGTPTHGLSGGVYVLPRDAAGLVRQLEQAAAPTRHCRRIGVMAAHGGVGASSLAAVLARRLAGPGRPVLLADLNPAGAPLEALLDLEVRSASWAGLLAGFGLAGGLPMWHGVSVLAGLGTAPATEAAWRFRAGLEAAETEGGLTVLDLSPASPGGPWRSAVWCDHLLLVARTDPAGYAAATRTATALSGIGQGFDLVARPVRGGVTAEALGGAIGAADVLVLPQERGLAAAQAHGLTPGDGARGPLQGLVSRWLAAHPEFERVADGASTAEHRRHRAASSWRPHLPGPRPKLPRFEPATFAEEW
ncbi:MAG: hypothetical protein LBR27_04215 [Bifidobacteriaceae bacterium]|jgi:Mrp family chromosome partitioning ATPase|nr:hypothetical protein [Bifidobacteriaceae bacterium]